MTCAIHLVSLSPHDSVVIAAASRPDVLGFVLASLLSLAAGLARKGFHNSTLRSDEEDIEVILVEDELDERDKAILDALRAARQAHVSELARKLGLRKSVVSRKLRKLESMGLVERVPGLGRLVYRLRG